jgi:hypothetical protein
MEQTAECLGTGGQAARERNHSLSVLGRIRTVYRGPNVSTWKGVYEAGGGAILPLGRRGSESYLLRGRDCLLERRYGPHERFLLAPQ